jgi:hypothetical protein
LYYNTVVLDSSYELPFDTSDDLFQKTYTTDELETLYELFDVIIGSQLHVNLNLKIKYNTSLENIVADYDSFEQFISKLFTASCPKLLQFNVDIQQLYLLHILSVLLIKCNERLLKLDDDAFFDMVYFPNLLFVCFKFFIKARQMIWQLMHKTHFEIKNDMRDVINYSDIIQILDFGVMKHDVMLLFFRDILFQFDPVSLTDHDSFYSLLIYKIIFCYLKLRVGDLPNDKFDSNIIQDKVMRYLSERSRIYGEAIYLAQLQEMCGVSSTTKHINICYDKLKSTIIPHELQRLFIFAVNKGQHMVSNNRILLMYTNHELRNVESFKQNIPSIYKLLKAVHVRSNNNNKEEFNTDALQVSVYTILQDRFKDMLSDDVSSLVIRNISSNLIASLFQGDFIDISTMTKVIVSRRKVVNELQYFLDSIFSEFNN